MSYAVKYRKDCIGKDGLTHRIDFLFDGYAGGVLSLGNADLDLYKLEIGALGANLFEPIRNSRLNIRLKRDSANVEDFMTDVEGAAYGSVIVNLYQGAVLAFVGLLETSLGERGRRNIDTIQLIAKTGYDYLDGVNFPVDGRMNFAEVWASCFSALPYQLGFFVDDWLKTSNGKKFGEIRVDTDIWRSVTNDGETVYKSCLDVLTETCTRFLLSVTQFSGYFHIQAPISYSGTTYYTEYDETGTEVSDDSDTLYKSYGDGAFIQVREYELERRKPHYAGASILYKHGELGGFANGGFEEWDGGTWVNSWTRSDTNKITRMGGDGVPITDQDLNFKKHIRINPFFAPSSTAPTELNIDNAYIESTQGIYLVSGTAFTFLFRAKWTIGNTGVFASEARSVFYRIKQGTNYWDAKNRAWTTTETINHALVDSEWTTIKTEVTDTPTSGYIEVRIYNGVDHIVSLRSGMTADNWDKTKWEFQAGAGNEPNIGYFLFDAVDVYLTDEEGKSPTETRTTVTSGITGVNLYNAETYFSDGITSTTKGRLTYLVSATETDTVEWDGAGITETPLDELIGRVLVRYLGKPQLAVSHRFLRVTSYLTPIEALENGTKFFPNYWFYDGTSGEFGGEFVEIVDFSISGTKSVFKNIGSFRDTSSGIAILRQQSQSLFNTGTANTLTRLSAGIPSGARTTIPIEALGSLALKVGDKITLVDRDTGELYTLTVAVKPTASATTLTIQSYTFPKPIRVGSPIYRSQGDLSAVVVQTDSVWRQMYKSDYICYVSGSQSKSTSGTLTVTPTTVPIPSGTKIWLPYAVSNHLSFNTTADVAEGATSIPFNGLVNHSNGTASGTFADGLGLKPEGFASTTEIRQNADEITLKASQNDLNTLTGTVTTHTTSISQNAYEITLRAERNKLINDINSVTQTALKINPDKIILDGEVETTRDIHSQGYSAGTSGWKISGAGNAEFNEVVVRGGLIDQDVVGKYVSLDEANGLIAQNAGNRTYVTPAQVYLTNGTNQTTMTPTSLQVKNKHAVLFVSDSGTYITVEVNGTTYDLKKN